MSLMPLMSSFLKGIQVTKSGARCSAGTRTSLGFWRSFSSSNYSDYETIKVETAADHVAKVQLFRPEKYNAINKTMWREIGDVFTRLDTDPECRSVVLCGQAKVFTSGIDVSNLIEMGQVTMGEDDIARKCFTLKKDIEMFQESLASLGKCRKPIVCAVSGPCIGAGVDMMSYTDIRYCTGEAWFQVKEVEAGLAADVGTLQMLPKIIGNQSLVNDLCLTCRKLPADEAVSCGLVSRQLPCYETLMAAATATAQTIAQFSPVAVQATKMALVYSRDHSVQEGLQFMQLLNMSLLQSEDTRVAAMSLLQKEKQKPTFKNL
ncbi:Crotonase superfamily [Trinorchestia longiramus]|nr:Crotonase superfamily [Trinorchestia longiramus]